MNHHVRFWWMQRVTSVLLLPLGIYVFAFLLCNAQNLQIQTIDGFSCVGSNALQVIVFLIFSRPVVVALFVLTALYHGTLGLQVILEDYISCACKRAVLIVAIYSISLATATAFLFMISSFVF